jgi:hypothetical protein
MLRGLSPSVVDGHVRTVGKCPATIAAGNDIENIAEGRRGERVGLPYGSLSSVVGERRPVPGARR